MVKGKLKVRLKPQEEINLLKNRVAQLVDQKNTLLERILELEELNTTQSFLKNIEDKQKFHKNIIKK